MAMVRTETLWPELPLAAWRDSRDTLHLWTQIVGKICLATRPWLNHSWHLALHVTARGLSTPPVSFAGRELQIEFDFIDHLLWLRLSDGASRRIALEPMTVAAFYAAVFAALRELGLDLQIDTTPNEIADAIPFERDETHRSYDPDFANRFWRILLRAHDVFSYFRTAFLGKASPVHFFWGSFNLAVTRFSGRRAPLHPGGIPHLSDTVVREAYSHEVVERRILARRRRDRLSGVLFLRLSRDRRICRVAGASGWGLLQPRARRVHPAL